LKELIFTERSLKDIKNISEFITAKWSIRVNLMFLNKLKSNFDLLLINPEIFPPIEQKKLSKCVVSKQTTIFYKIEKNQIIIVSVFDTRQNPLKINKIK
jgi:plasmid stabilization system protein ParE